MIKKDYQLLFKKCFSCNSLDHLFEECPFLHYIPNKENIIQKYLFVQPSSRSDFKRRNDIKFITNALKNYGHRKSLEKKSHNNLNEFEAMFLRKNSKNSSGLASYIEDEENSSFQEMENIEKEYMSQLMEKSSSYEIKLEEEKEHSPIGKEKESGSQENYKITFVKEQQHISLKDDFEKLFIENFELKRQIILSQSKHERNCPNLFDFDFEKAHEFKFYNKNDNFDKIINEYKKSTKAKNKMKSQKFKKRKKL